MVVVVAVMMTMKMMMMMAMMMLIQSTLCHRKLETRRVLVTQIRSMLLSLRDGIYIVHAERSLSVESAG